MTLDRELAATFGQEAEMREIPLPDVDGLIRGGRARRRRRNLGRIGVAAATAAVLVGGAYGVAQVDPRGPGTATVPPATSESGPSDPDAAPQRFQHLDGVPMEPGTYRMLVGTDLAGADIEADLTVSGPGWIAGDQPVVSEGDTSAGVAVYEPEEWAGAAPCTGDWQSRDAGVTTDVLVKQIVRLPWSKVVQAPTPTKAFGHDATHVRLRIDDQCPGGEYYQLVVWPIGSRVGSHGLTYTYPDNEVVIDFWVVDLDGTAVVVERWHHVDASAELVARVTKARDSIAFVTAE